MSTTKLTKKQKKGLAFRERKGKGKAKDAFDEQLTIPEADPPTEEPFQNEQQETNALPTEAKTMEEVPSTTGVQSKKRKREKDAPVTKELVAENEKSEDTKGGDDVPRKKKKQKVEAKEGTEGAKAKKVKEGEGKEKKDEKKDERSRFILFLGNLKYTTPVEAIEEHFSKCDPPPKVRLLTPKPKAPGGMITKSKGCAFLEFSHRNALQQGLKLHGSVIDGRQINVELTAGGGGKSEQRLKKVTERNKSLLEERKTRVQKKMEAGDNSEADIVAPPQRHSSTSGVDLEALRRRTWTVPEEGEESGRGAKQRGKKSRGPSRPWGTGANAIAVG
ncbi:hypothetical protein M422DRAFT_66729 [Sphaerobolus stellatus SS14]|nr:hypothetical protein M422DRAFT_66729 [Sphaerobolus stellatus SS14]